MLSNCFQAASTPAVLLKSPPQNQSDNNNMNWCVYLLLCDNGALYAGISNRPEARLAAHLAGNGAKYTRSHSAREMRIVACCLDRSAASKLEWALKRMTAAQKRALWAMGWVVVAEGGEAA